MLVRLDTKTAKWFTRTIMSTRSMAARPPAFQDALTAAWDSRRQVLRLNALSEEEMDVLGVMLAIYAQDRDAVYCDAFEALLKTVSGHRHASALLRLAELGGEETVTIGI